MKVHHNISALPAFNNAVVTIGTFDGVHSGHRQIIELMKAEADAVQGETVIITFDPHPRQVVKSGAAPVYLINTLPEKLSLLEKYGIDHVVVVPFTDAFAAQPAETYVSDFLVRTFHPHTIIIGYDHRFGKDRQGDFRLLESLGETYQYKVREIPAYMLEDVSISSTRIRTALLSGDIADAQSCLGYAYFFSGTVVEGNKLGRTIGYPTANLQLSDEQKLIPANGVYAVQVQVNGGVVLNGMMNIGVRPTVDGTKRVIEVNIFDFNQDIYGQVLTVTVCHHLRAEQKFNGLDALKAQLGKDQLQAAALLQR